MIDLTAEQVEAWVLNLLEKANAIDYDHLDVMAVSELVGTAKSALVLLTEEQATEYHKRIGAASEHSASQRASSGTL